MAASIDWSEVERVARESEQDGGIVGVAVRAPSGEGWSWRGDRHFRAASTVKIPIMVAIQRAIDQGKHRLDEPYVLRDAAKAPGSGILLHLHDGVGLTLADLLYLMISISDNTATNILIDMAGMETVNNAIRSLGMTGSTLGRRMLGRPAREEDGEHENWATPDDYVRAVAAVLDGTAASPAACARMIELLERQQNPRRIARHLPRGTRWGSKTGSIAGVVNDAGYIMGPGGTLIIVVYCENPADQHEGERIIGAITRAALRVTAVLHQPVTATTG